MVSGIIPRVKAPKTAAPGEVINITAKINHKMEYSDLTDRVGARVRRSIINRFTCDFGDQNVIDVTLEPGISADPVIEFSATLMSSGRLNFVWYDDNGDTYEVSRLVKVA